MNIHHDTRIYIRTSWRDAGTACSPNAAAAKPNASGMDCATPHAGASSPAAPLPIVATSLAGVAFGCDEATATKPARRAPSPPISLGAGG